MLTIEKLYAPDESLASSDDKPRRRVKKAAEKANGVKKPAKVKAKAAKVKAAKPAKGKRTRDPAKLDEYGYTKGCIKSLAAAMYANNKTKGATLGEVRAELNSTQFNLITEQEAKGRTITRTKEDGEGNRPITRYWIRKQ